MGRRKGELWLAAEQACQAVRGGGVGRSHDHLPKGLGLITWHLAYRERHRSCPSHRLGRRRPATPSANTAPKSPPPKPDPRPRQSSHRSRRRSRRSRSHRRPVDEGLALTIYDLQGVGRSRCSPAPDGAELEFAPGMLLGPRTRTKVTGTLAPGTTARRTAKDRSASGVDRLGESGSRCRRRERVREVLRLVRDEVVTELHDAHRDRRYAVVCDHALAYPHRTGAEHPP